MPQEGSVAPKERVNIVYRPATGGAQQEVELPLKVLVMGDFTLKSSDTPVENRKPINVDKDNFNEVMKAQKLGLSIAVPNKLSGKEGDNLSVNLNFKNLNDFNPDAVVSQVPELKKLIEMREALKALKGPLGNIPEFRKKIQEIIKDEGTRQRLLKELGIEEGKK